MWRKFWTVAIAFVFIACLASVADAQGRPNGNQNPPNGNQGNGTQGNGNQGNGNQGNNPGNSHQNNPPGNGHQNDPPGNGHHGDDPPGGGTPDGETPANEDVCDGLQGATPGLYGLCIAFCEAHDCDPVMGEDGLLDFSGCKKNDRKLLDKYRRRMRDGDPDMPCIPVFEPPDEDEGDEGGGGEPLVECPCWGPNEVAVFPNWDPFCMYEAWNDIDGDGECLQEVNQIYDSTYFADDDYSEFVMIAARDDGCFDGTYCYWEFDCVGPTCPELDFNDIWVDISDEEFDACKEQILQMQETYCY